MDIRKIILIVIGVFSIFALTGYVFRENLLDGVFAVLGLVLLVVGYLSGFFALLFGVLFSIFYLVTSLPVISTFYGWIIFTLSKIHYALFNLIFKKILHRMKWYSDLKSRVENSREYKGLASFMDGFLKGLGLKSPPAVQLFQIKKCGNCERKIPIDSIFCPYCGKRLT